MTLIDSKKTSIFALALGLSLNTANAQDQQPAAPLPPPTVRDFNTGINGSKDTSSDENYGDRGRDINKGINGSKDTSSDENYIKYPI